MPILEPLRFRVLRAVAAFAAGCLGVVCGPVPVLAASEAQAAEVSVFRESNPCPSTGSRTGACPGHEIDHVIPRCLGGPDNAYNMQWRTTAQYREQARTNAKACPASRGGTTS